MNKVTDASVDLIKKTAELENQKQLLAAVQSIWSSIQSGEAGGDWLNPDWKLNKDGQLNATREFLVTIVFAHPFKNPPTVFAALKHIDVDTSQNARG
jgi:hypothetical protein